MSTQSASRPALGYIYQTIDYSLYIILKDRDQLERQLFVERLDDIEIVSKYQHQPIQVKRTATPLNDRNENWWKTIGNWSEGISNNSFQIPRTFFTLVTTANVPNGSIASLLRPAPDSCRNPELALQKLIKVAEQPSSTISSHTQKFMNLSMNTRMGLVEAIQILDNAPDFEELKQKTKELLLWSVHKENIDNFYDLFMAWWRGQIINHLEIKAQTPITLQAVQGKIQSLRDEFSSMSLPIHYRDAEPPMPPEIVSGNVQFIKQLESIQAMRDIEHAKRAYIKAVAQRHEWEKTEPLIGQELENYEKRLRDKWEGIRNLQLADFELDNRLNEVEDKELQRLGLRLYQEIRKLNIPIRPNVYEEYITQGSFHILANYAPPKVGWHPKFDQLFPLD